MIEQFRDYRTGEFSPMKADIKAVLDTIPNDQYVDGYVDPKGKAGFRNPVREVIGDGLTALVETLQIKSAVELGTALGRSGLHMALGGLERLSTVEFDGEAAVAAQHNFDKAGLDNFQVFKGDSGDFTKNWNEDGIELIFIDHAKERYLEDFMNIEAHLADDALVLMDNTFNRASECKDAVAYVADGYYASIFTEPSSPGQEGAETTGLLVASRDPNVFFKAIQTLVETRGHASQG